MPLVKMIPLSQSVQTAATTGRESSACRVRCSAQCVVCRYVFSAKGEVKKDVYEQFLDIVG